MKILSIVLNFTLLAFVGGILINEGFPDFGNVFFWMICLVLISPLVTLGYFFVSNAKVNAESLISLYFQRKRLEEKNKINSLSKNNNP